MYAAKREQRDRVALAMAASALVVACSVDEPTAPLNRVAAPVVVASQFHVTSTADDGSDGTLRKEIADAADGDTVTIDAALAGQTITLTNGMIDILKSVTILGPGSPGVTISGGGTTRLFRVAQFDDQLELQDVILTGGFTDTNGGAIIATGALILKRVTVTGNEALIHGGGILSSGPLQIIDSKIMDNRVEAAGAGLYVSDLAPGGPVLISRSTIADNLVKTQFSFGGGANLRRDAIIEHSTFSGNTARLGGGFITGAGTTITVVNSTISGNIGLEGSGVYVFGAAVLRHVTITGNDGGVALKSSPAQTLTLHNTIIAGNLDASQPNCMLGAPATYQGNNLFGDTDCGSSAIADIATNPMLGPLANNGGPTQTHALLRGSPAVDRAPTCVVSDDQRGVARPLGPKCDLGAIEFDNYISTTLTVDPSGTANQSTGVAVVSGTHTCSEATGFTLRITVKQKAKAKKVPTEIVGSTDINVACDAKAVWAAAVPPLTGAFSNSPVSVTVQPVNLPHWITPTSVTAPSVIMAWSRR